jgi:hypothetical protein
VDLYVNRRNRKPNEIIKSRQPKRDHFSANFHHFISCQRGRKNEKEKLENFREFSFNFHFISFFFFFLVWLIFKIKEEQSPIQNLKQPRIWIVKINVVWKMRNYLKYWLTHHIGSLPSFEVVVLIFTSVCLLRIW